MHTLTYGNSSFKTAFLISLFIHLLVVFPWSGISERFRKRDLPREVTVSYFNFSPDREAMSRTGHQRTVSSVSENRDPQPRNEVKVDEREPAPVKEKPDVKEMSGDKSREIKSGETAAAEDLPSEGEASAEELVVTGDYRNMVRRQIQTILSALYSKKIGQGSVNLLFVLDREGNLVSAEVDNGLSEAPRALKRLALYGLKSASPFPPFPKKVSREVLSFSLSVNFQKD